MVPYSYRSDPSVPAFDDRAPIIVFDGLCVLCSGGVQALFRLDRKALFKVAAIQQPIPQALYRHYGLNAQTFDTFLLLADGLPHVKADAVLEVARRLGGVWALFAAAGRLMPKGWRDAIYDWVQRNRIGWFGARQTCLMPTPDVAARFLAGATPQLSA
jgi:predicted DCC family thiol-disulfide oxidoreductase YuxK